MGVLEWSPDQFWSATPRDLYAALDGWREKNSPPDGAGGSRKLSKSDIDDLRDLIANEPRTSKSIRRRK